MLTPMLSFICPYCQQTLQVAPQQLGQRGRCNKCGGRIALVGRADAQRPQMASQVFDPDNAPGTTPAAVPTAAARAEQEAPTARQLEHLQRLGASPQEIAALRSNAEASRLIDARQPPPTKSQIAYLERLGATPELLARVKTKAQASALIEKILALP